MSKVVILLNGSKRAGKDFVAQQIKELKPETDIYSFANRMKRIIADTFGISREELEKYKNEETVVSIGGVPTTNMRKILQRFGTEAMKPIFGSNIWTQLMRADIVKSKSPLIVIPDWRYTSEYTYLSEMLNCKIITVYIENHDIQKKDTHISENDLVDFSFEHCLDNTGHKLNKENISNFLKSLE